MGFFSRAEEELDVTLVRWEVCSSVAEVVGEGGVRVKSTSSHQSISVQFLMPHAANHVLLPSGTKKWTFGCRFEISTTVGWERWS